MQTDYTAYEDDTSKRGANFFGQEHELRRMVHDLMREHPSYDRYALLPLFLERIEGREDWRKALAWYFLKNMYTYRKRALLAADEEAQAAREEAMQEAVKRTIENPANQIALLLLIMPNGRAMRDCTGIEMGRFGEGYARIAERVGPDIVGEVLTEGEVRSLMKVADERG